MIRSYRDRRAKSFAEGKTVRNFQGFKRQAEKWLEILDAAESLGDLAALSSNRLEALIDDRQGQHSIAINRQWRICFLWHGDGAESVEIVDYH